MSETKWTKGPWIVNPADKTEVMEGGAGGQLVARTPARLYNKHAHDDARLLAAAPELYEALALYKAWADSECAGPDYGGQTRDTHPDGQKIWQAWWDNQLDLCDRASRATDAALLKARGE